ncbi:MAG TPA: LCP family protein [Anaerolineae bacterium]|nr:LCP family protein [Anaerolineae bacterium]
MQKQAKLLPAWLINILGLAIILSGLTVSGFAFMTAQIVMSQPLNPAETVAEFMGGRDSDGDGGLFDPVVTREFEEIIPTVEPIETQDLPAVDGEGRINVLVMGIDRRPGEPFISRTDSMMLLSLDVEENKASILSIPRDLYVAIPGRGRDRINTAFVYGSSGNNPAGGATLAMETVAYNLGVHVHHYVLVDFGAVINGVDILGGIDVTVPFNISDPTYPDMNYGYEPLYIAAGQQHFDGELALKYARTRHQDNDFGRAQRQQQVVMAVRAALLDLGAGELLVRSPNLYQQVRDGIRTDLSLEQLVSLGLAGLEVEQGDVQAGVLDYQYVSSYTTEGGASVLILDNGRAAELIQQLFYD